jgi:hypothetical protein
VDNVQTKNTFSDFPQPFLNLNTGNSFDTVPILKFDLSNRAEYKRPLWLRRVQSELYLKIPEERFQEVPKSVVKDGDSWIDHVIQKTKMKIALPKKTRYGDLEETTPIINGDDWIPEVPAPVVSEGQENINPIQEINPTVFEKGLDQIIFGRKSMKITIPTGKFRDDPTDTRTAPVDIGDSWITLAMMGQSDTTLSSVPADAQTAKPQKTKWYRRLFSRTTRNNSRTAGNEIND